MCTLQMDCSCNDCLYSSQYDMYGDSYVDIQDQLEWEDEQRINKSLVNDICDCDDCIKKEIEECKQQIERERSELWIFKNYLTNQQSKSNGTS